MRTSYINIEGKRYPLCFSMRVMDACVDRYGSWDAAWDCVVDNRREDTCWLLNQLMTAGKKYAEMQGDTAQDPIDAEALYDMIGLQDIEDVNAAIYDTVRKGRETTVKIETKNEKAM